MRLISTTGLVHAGLSVAFVVTLALVNWISASEATAKRAVPDSVKVACSGDYKRFCPGYEIGSSKLDRCMRSNGKRLSNVCVRELVDNGMVPRSLLSKARRR
ncbi:MAG: hypothetical protein APF80_12045 [Alphaproteobacteria bacterium BRH_c36]|nr:MAG: hypothetical protein APF80_12045 [Alphaproteobacteria bacterium BRH_c36]